MKITARGLSAVAILAAGIYLLPVAYDKVADARPRTSAHEMAPEFKLKTMDGKNIRLADFRGRVVLINFFASWCPPCKSEIPGFERMYTMYGNRGFSVISIALDDVSPSFVRQMGITYPITAATDEVIRDYGFVSSVPVSFLIGKDGRIIKQILGVYREENIKTDVESALRS